MEDTSMNENDQYHVTIKQEIETNVYPHHVTVKKELDITDNSNYVNDTTDGNLVLNSDNLKCEIIEDQNPFANVQLSQVTSMDVDSQEHSIQNFSVSFKDEEAKNLYKQSLNQQSSKENYSCDICNRTFTSNAYLTNHKSIHIEKQYSCDLCDKRFTFLGNFNKHKQTHMGEEPYSCDICDKKFRLKNSLKRHKKLHSNSEECDKKLTDEAAPGVSGKEIDLQERGIKSDSENFKDTETENNSSLLKQRLEMQSLDKQQKKGYHNCSVDGCLNSTLNSEFSFFKLPAASDRRAEWLRLIHREDLIASNCRYAHVCEAHFSPDSIIRNSIRKLLKKNAIPQQLIPLPNFANKGIQAIVETADAKVQCFYDFQTYSQTQTPLHLLNNIPRVRKLLSELQECRKRLKIKNNRQSDRNTFFMLCDKFLNPKLARVVKQQTKIKTYGPGNRFSLDYKIFCLNLYNLSPQAYNLLKDTLCLPSKQTLRKMYMPVTTKIGSYLMDILKTKAQYMSDMDRNCSLVVNAMSLKANLFYNIKEGRIYGFHEVDGVQSPKPAKYALVAMIQGLNENYNHPVGFALLAEYKNDPSVTNWIDKLIQKLYSIGFHVRCLVSDKDFLNIARDRSVSAESPFFFVGDRKIYCIFDPPNLIKLVRNNLINYEFHFDNNVAKWNHILQFYEMDKLKRLRLAPKLTDSHIKPNNFEKMNVKYAVQVLSATVAAGLSIYRDFGIIENSAEGTIKMIEIMNNLFDFFNPSSRYGSTQYQSVFCGEEHQIAFVSNVLNFYASLKLIDPNNGQNVSSKVKFIEGFQITLKSLLMLFEDLRIEGFSCVMTSRLNQDCLENFFGQIRRKNGNNKPTSWRMILAFRKIFFMNILKSPKSGNWTDDFTKCLQDCEKLYAPFVNEADPETNSTMVSNREENQYCAKTNLISTTDYNTLDLPNNNTLVYVSGYLLRKCLDHHKECNDFLAYTKGGDNAHDFSHTFARYKNCCDGTKSLSTIPPDSFVEFVGSMEERFCNFFGRNYLDCEILKSLLNDVQSLTFSMPCKCFPLTYCKQLYIRMRIYDTLKYNNRAFRRRRKIFSVTKLF